MSLLNVPAGKDLPEDIYVVIEIPANADPIKYEIDKESGALFVDRFEFVAEEKNFRIVIALHINWVLITATKIYISVE